MRPLLVLAGTFAPQRVSEVYYASLYSTRVIALPGGGRDRLHRTYSTISETVLAWAERQEEPIVLAGHSQGAIHALTFALDYPHLVDNVVGIAGPFGGANSPAISPGLYPHVERFIPVGVDFQKGSDYLLELQQRASVEQTVPITLVAGKRDSLVTPASAHAIVPSTRVLFNGGHTTVLRQREVRHLLKSIRSKEI